MIFDELVLHNFGLFRGRQTIALAPLKQSAPVILFGGLNGAGKTTLLDGIHLALYGKRARCSNRANLGYDAFLERSIHRGVSPTEGAAVELQFRHWSEGREQTYRVQRSWRKAGRGIREEVEVLKGGSIDRAVTDAWYEHVEGFMPHGIANLFLFDGEKIEELADAENARTVLATAIGSLLGLEVIDQLCTDLLLVEAKKRRAAAPSAVATELDGLGKEMGAIQADRDRVSLARGGFQNAIDGRRKALAAAEERLALAGGDLFADRLKLEAQRAALQGQLAAAQEALHDLAAGHAPLLLLQDHLDVVAEQALGEERAAQASLTQDLLRRRDEAVLTLLRQKGASAEVVAGVSDLLTEDLRARALVQQQVDTYLGLSGESGSHLRSLCADRLAETRQRLHHLVDENDRLAAAFLECERKIASIPHDDEIKDLAETRERLALELALDEGKLAGTEKELERLTRVFEQKKAEYEKVAVAKIDAKFVAEDDARILRHSARVRGTMATFRGRLVARHVDRIQKLVLDSFRKLLRKESLVDDLRIDPQTFAVTLTRAAGEPIETDTLSAGERQLLAVSMLWGLARASGRPLPAVIDTPLGRLDSTHRHHLVERYFPHASHQVLLLSTDEEIDAEYHDLLRPWIGRAYTLQFDEQRGQTTVRDGYFGAKS